MSCLQTTHPSHPSFNTIHICIKSTVSMGKLNTVINNFWLKHLIILCFFFFFFCFFPTPFHNTLHLLRYRSTTGNDQPYTMWCLAHRTSRSKWINDVRCRVRCVMHHRVFVCWCVHGAWWMQMPNLIHSMKMQMTEVRIVFGSLGSSQSILRANWEIVHVLQFCKKPN